MPWTVYRKHLRHRYRLCFIQHNKSHTNHQRIVNYICIFSSMQSFCACRCRAPTVELAWRTEASILRVTVPLSSRATSAKLVRISRSLLLSFKINFLTSMYFLRRAVLRPATVSEWWHMSGKQYYLHVFLSCRLHRRSLRDRFDINSFSWHDLNGWDISKWNYLFRVVLRHEQSLRQRGHLCRRYFRCDVHVSGRIHWNELWRRFESNSRHFLEITHALRRNFSAVNVLL